MRLSSYALRHFPFSGCVWEGDKPRGHNETVKRKELWASPLLEKTNPSTVLQNSLVGQQARSQSILMGKYSSVDLKLSLHEYFRPLLTTLSPSPDQSLNNGLKEKLYYSIALAFRMEFSNNFKGQQGG